jgi:hypothetical protein
LDGASASINLAIAHLPHLLSDPSDFLLVLFVLHRWTASASSYSLLLMPLMTMTLGALILDEQITPSLIWGGISCNRGVYVGVFFSSRPAFASGPASGSSSRPNLPD